MKNRIILFLALIIFSMLLLVPSVSAKNVEVGDVITIGTTAGRPDDYFDTNCADFAKTIRIAGYVVFFLKIVVPLLIIGKSSLDLYSVVMQGTAEEAKKKSKMFAISVASGILIFMVPTIVDTIFGLVDKYVNGHTTDASICSACVFEPFSTECSQHAD